MTVNNISFGQVTKINAPIQVAKKVADIANDEQKKSVFCNIRNRKLKTQIKSAFPDVKEGKAVVYSDKDNVSFIFSGRDALEFNVLYAQHQLDADHAEYYYSALPSAGMFKKIEEDNYHKQVLSIISNSYKVFEADVAYDAKNNKPVSLKIIG